MPGLLADDADRLFVRAQAAEHRMPDPAGPRPFAEGDLRNQLRLDPMRVAGQFGIRCKCRLLRCECVQPLADVAQRALVKAGADVAGVTQLALFVVHTEQ